MATTTAIPLTQGEASSPKQFNGPPAHCRRKMKKLCCCLTFLLLLNVLLTMHISHSICRVASIFWNDDVVLMPGGETSFCNDFCADLCVNGQNFRCDIVSCLNNCNLHFGNTVNVYQDEGDDEVYYDTSYYSEPHIYGTPDEEPVEDLPDDYTDDYYYNEDEQEQHTFGHQGENPTPDAQP
mmetsp:Transcript_48893/g.43837  ORF Transcript_48893/g.43837 Transcript_48893/m.43837 type:complete len:181 (-) Transcript_48893:283-825(-)